MAGLCATVNPMTALGRQFEFRITVVEPDVEISQRSVGSVAVLDLVGCLTVEPIGFAGGRLHRIVDDLVSTGCRHIVVNLGGVTDIDARGLGALATTVQTVWMAGGRVALVGASPHIERLLAVTRLNSVCTASEPEASMKDVTDLPVCPESH